MKINRSSRGRNRKRSWLAVLEILAMLLGLLFNTGAVHAQTGASGTVVAWGRNVHGEGSVPAGLSDVTTLAASWNHSLALKADGTVVGWGYNAYGQSSAPAGLSGVTAIDAGVWHSLALKADGTVVAWGDDTYGQGTVPAGLSGVIAVAAGEWHNLVLKADGTVVAWGHYGYGQINVPTGLSGVTAIDGGAWHSLALKADGTVVAWGSNYYGQSSVPDSLSGVTAIAAGASHSLALKADGTVVAWGRNDSGQSTVPEGLSGVTAIAAGASHSLALKADGTVVAWGSNGDGESSVPAGLNGVTAIAAGAYHNLALQGGRPIFLWGDNGAGYIVPPADLTSATAITPGRIHSLALKSDGTIVGWGYNNFGQLNIPAGLSGVKAIAVSSDHSLALKSDGTVLAWGTNYYGETDVPTGLNGVIQTATGITHSLALKSDGTVLAWGSNHVGEINVPAGLTGVKAIAAGGSHSLALKSDGTVVGWGYNQNGEINIPAGLNGVIAISAGTFHSLALKSDGTVIAWGYNAYGQGTVPDGLSGIVAIDAGGFHNLALRSNGTVVAWGSNSHGQLNVPARLQNVTVIAGGETNSLALGNLNQAPIAQNQSTSMNEDTQQVITLAATDAENAALTYSIVAMPAHGTLSGTAPNITYTPNADWNGTDHFTFKANDGLQDSNIATVTITVNSVNDAPVTQDQSVSTDEDTPLVITPMTTDVDNNPLTYSIITAPAHGVLSITPPNLTYTPDAGYYGPDSFTFKANDGMADSNVATVSIAVAHVNHAPVAQDQSLTTNEGTALEIILVATDADNDSLTYSIVTGPTNGALSGEVPVFTYTPNGSYAGPDSITFSTNDGTVDSNVATVNITVSQTNTAPVANPGGPYLGAINTAISFDGSGSSDADGDPLTYAWTIGDGATGTDAAPAHSYTAAGIYNVCLIVNDGSLDSAQACTIAVVYDPSAGFVTGGGWIDSPAGAYKADETLAGKATFGFVSKYQKGANVPTGTTAFEFDLAGLAFSSQSYEWLVVNQGGSNAQFKGSGTINDGLDPNGNAYKFMLWAGDGSSTDSADTFRIRIWWEDAAGEHDVYDNGVEQPIGGGNIVVHTKK